jgi:hypothetical protein
MIQDIQCFGHSVELGACLDGISFVPEITRQTSYDLMEANLHDDRENEKHGAESFPFFARMLRCCGAHFAS